MTEQVRRILLKEMYDEINAIDAIYDDISKLEAEKTSLPMITPDIFVAIDPTKGRSLFYKIFRRKKYKREVELYKSKKAECEQQNKAFDLQKKRIIEIDKKIEELKKQLEELNSANVKERYNRIKMANNIKEMGIDFNSVVALLRKNNIPLVLDEKDSIIDTNESEFDKTEDFILVRKTNHPPVNGIVQSVESAGLKKKKVVDLGGTIVDFDYALCRNTVHFTANGEVSQHIYGAAWDSMKYAILIPLDKIKNLTTFTTVDAYTTGPANVSEGYLLCPFDEMEKLQELNPHMTIIGYRGKNAKNMANVLLSMLGYKKEGISNFYWVNDKDNAKAHQFITTKTEYKWIAHANSTEKRSEVYNTAINEFISFIDKILEKNIDFDLFKAVEMIYNKKQLDIVYYYSDRDFLYDYHNIYIEQIVSLLNDYNIQCSIIYYDPEKFKSLYGEEVYDRLLALKEKNVDSSVIFFLYDVLFQVKNILKKDKEVDRGSHKK